MALTHTAPLGNVISDSGRVDAKRLALSIDVTLPTLARALGKSPRRLHDDPTAKSIQTRALQIVDRVNKLAEDLGGTKFALAWLNLPTAELGGESAMDYLTSGDDRKFAVGLNHIDLYLMMVPD